MALRELGQSSLASTITVIKTLLTFSLKIYFKNFLWCKVVLGWGVWVRNFIPHQGNDFDIWLMSYCGRHKIIQGFESFDLDFISIFFFFKLNPLWGDSFEGRWTNKYACGLRRLTRNEWINMNQRLHTLWMTNTLIKVLFAIFVMKIKFHLYIPPYNSFFTLYRHKENIQTFILWYLLQQLLFSLFFHFWLKITYIIIKSQIFKHL